jgi:hypothetical protein
MMNCCHGGCNNCDFSRIFDEMNAGRAKWIALYRTRELIDGRSHDALFDTIFAESDPITYDEFQTKLSNLPGKMCMGTPPFSNSDDLNEQVVFNFWSKVTSEVAVENKDSISSEEV